MKVESASDLGAFLMRTRGVEVYIRNSRMGVLRVPMFRKKTDLINREWKTAADRLGLTFRPISFDRSALIHGTLGNIGVKVEGSEGEAGSSATRYTVTHPDIPRLRMRKLVFVAEMFVH